MSKPLIDVRRRRMLATGTAVAASPFLFHIARAQGAPIKIGFPVPLTGAFSAEAQDQVRAARSRSRISTTPAGSAAARPNCWCATTSSTPAKRQRARWS